MTKKEFEKAAIATGKVLWTKYSGNQKTFYVCCLDSHIGDHLQEIAKGANFKIKIG